MIDDEDENGKRWPRHVFCSGEVEGRLGRWMDSWPATRTDVQSVCRRRTEPSDGRKHASIFDDGRAGCSASVPKWTTSGQHLAVQIVFSQSSAFYSVYSSAAFALVHKYATRRSEFASYMAGIGMPSSCLGEWNDQLANKVGRWLDLAVLLLHANPSL